MAAINATADKCYRNMKIILLLLLLHYYICIMNKQIRRTGIIIQYPHDF